MSTTPIEPSSIPPPHNCGRSSNSYTSPSASEENLLENIAEESSNEGSRINLPNSPNNAFQSNISHPLNKNGLNRPNISNENHILNTGNIGNSINTVGNRKQVISSNVVNQGNTTLMTKICTENKYATTQPN